MAFYFCIDLLFGIYVLTFEVVFGHDRLPFLTDEELAAVNPITVTLNDTKHHLTLRADNADLPTLGKAMAPFTWPNAIVPYTVDSGFNDQQRSEVAKALKTYMDATCIRFVPKRYGDNAWVDILYDADACGVAEVCKQDGGQYAKFGGDCVTAGVMVHELGHTLCMSHEMSRLDRDNWIAFNTSICNPPAKDPSQFTLGLNKLYDYLSVEHYEGECYNGCYLPKEEGVTKCGSGGSLSVLDIELLNEVYGCNTGCYGYRFVNSKQNLTNMVQGGAEANGDPLYTCRAYHEGDIIPGKYHAGKQECYVPYNGNENIKTGDHVEILTNPNNVNLEWKNLDSLPGNAVKGGRSSERETLYVIRCQITDDGNNLQSPGKYQPSVGASTSYGGVEIRCENFEYLVCS